MTENILLTGLFFLPFLGALSLFAFRGKKAERAWGMTAQVTAVAEFVLALFFGVQALFGAGFACRIEQFAGFGLSFVMDAFRAVYLIILTFMWMTAVVFSPEYMRQHENKRRYYLFTLLTLGATAGVFLAADLMTMFIFFEVMSFTSYVWVAQEETKGALRAAETYLAVAVVGGMVMLMGLFLLYHLTGTFAMSELKAACAAAENKGELFAAGCLMLFGFGAKAGMFPLHIWLPKAHPVAPAPASALLSGVLTKAGIFGVILLSGSVLYGVEKFGWIVLVLGTVTMFWGALLGVFSIDLKRTFACSSVSQIGFILVGLGMMNLTEENTLAVNGSFLHMVNHSLIKLVLFLLAGVVYKNLHTLDFNEIRGFGKGKPFFLAAYVSGAFAIGGVPFFSGYVSKTMLHEAIVEGSLRYTGELHTLLSVIEWIFLISGGMTVAYMLKVFFVLFVDAPSETVKRRDTGNYLSLQVKILLGIPAVLFLAMGVLPGGLMQPLAAKAEAFFYGGSTTQEAETLRYFSLENLKGAAISLVIGVFLYFVVVRLWLRRKEDGAFCYVNRLPAWFDLEETVYRPFFAHLLPFVLAVVCRVLDKLVDGIIYVLRRFVFAEVKPKEQKNTDNRLAYFGGSVLDGISGLLNRTVRKNRPITKSYVQLLSVGEEEIARTVRLVTRSVSYGLMLSCIGLLLTIIYLLLG